jgi:hypothetical protein
MMRTLGFVVVLLAVVLLVGFGVLNGQVGAIVSLGLLIVSGIGWRLVKLFTGLLMMFFAFL